MAQSIWGGFRTIATGAISRAKEQIKEMTQENLQESIEDPNIRHLLEEIKRIENRNSKLKELLTSKDDEIQEFNTKLSSYQEENNQLLTDKQATESKLLNLEQVKSI